MLYSKGGLEYNKSYGIEFFELGTSHLEENDIRLCRSFQIWAQCARRRNHE